MLAWAADEPGLAHWSDNVRILATLAEAGRLPADLCNRLTQAYRDLRSASHQLALQQQARRVPASEFATASAAVREGWQTLFSCAPGSDPDTETVP